MLPWIQLDSAKVPGDTAELRLKQRGSEFSIMLGANELMNSRLSGSEEALATLATERLPHQQRPVVLIGGLGMGFTLRAALAVLPVEAEIIVAELVPEVVAWARGPMADVFKGSLDDPRVAVHVGDVGALIKASKTRFDAILLDVDNGPDGLTRTSNDSLYDHAGLRAALLALRPKGVLGVWSSGPDDRFTRRLRECGFSAEALSVRASTKRSGARHVIWMAVKP
jgi:spermidine synthase